MKMGRIILSLALIGILCHAALADDPPADPRDAEIKMLRATVKHQAEDVEPLRDRLAASQSHEKELLREIELLKRQVVDLSAKLQSLDQLHKQDEAAKLAMPSAPVVIAATKDPAVSSFADAVSKVIPVFIARHKAELDEDGRKNPDQHPPHEKEELEVQNADVKKSDSLVNPMVGVVKIRRYRSWRFDDNNGVYGWISLLTITIVPGTGGGWKCVHADERFDSGPHTGETVDVTEQIQSLLGK